MPSKLQYYSNLADQTAAEITGSQQKWLAFLQTMARVYKYPYHEQLMIYAQRPEATACAEYDIWNRRMGRFVKRGSTGIALIDTTGDNPKLKYVFDVADTGGGAKSRKPKLWEFRQEHDKAVRDALTKRFEVGGITLADQLEETARFIVDDYWYDHKENILSIIDGSFLADYDDEETIRYTFCEAAAVSVGYTLLYRCGLETEERYEPADFMQVFDFNTPQTVAALGSCVSESSETVLRQIEVVIKKYEREKQTERSNEYEQSELHPERGLQNPRSETVRTEREASGQIRENAETVPERTSPGALEQPAAVGETVSAPERNRQHGERETGADAPQNDGTERGERTAESGEPHDVGAADEQPESTGRGSDSAGADLQLTDGQISFFPTEAEQIEYISQAESVQVTPSAFSLPQNCIDQILQLGSNAENAHLILVSEFSKQKPTELLVPVLKRLYHGGCGLENNGKPVCAWYGEDGIHLTQSRSARYSRAAQILSWEDAAKRIGELLEQGQFASNTEVTEAPGAERKRLADALWYLTSDLSEAAANQDYLHTVRELQGGFPEETKQIADMLADPEAKNTIIQQCREFVEAYRDDSSILRFHYHKPETLLQQLMELDTPRREYFSDLKEIKPVQNFITEDELDAALSSGSGVAGSKERVYDFFRQNHTAKEKAEFLKAEYGTGGRSHALSGAPWSEEEHDAKGERFKKRSCPDVSFSWEKTARRIDELIRSDRYLSQEEKEDLNAVQEAHTEKNAPETVQPLSDTLEETLDAALQAWNGDMESKRTTARYMEEHGRERAAADWLRDQFGKDVFSADGTPVPWTKVQRRLARLIREDRFFTDQEKDAFENMDPAVIREKLSERGIENGRVVDSSKLDRDPFIRQVMTDAENISQNRTDKQAAINTLTDSQKRIVEAMETAGFTYQPRYGNEEYEVFTDQAGYPLTFDSWDKTFEWINSAELNENAEIRSKVQTILHPNAEVAETPARISDAAYASQYLIPNETTFRWNDRRFVVDKINYSSGTVELKDITFAENVGFPIFRTEPISAVRQYLESQPEEEIQKNDFIPAVPVTAENFHITDNHLGEGGPKAKFLDNLNAIHLLKKLELEERQAEPDEQEVLSRYVGWGGLADAFDPDKPAWTKEYQELKEALTPAEYEAARGSTLNAHYTSPAVIRAIYEAVGNMGFETGNILEPSCGVGNFFGMLPPAMEGSRLYGVELDSISGRIAQKLYPKADITVAGFETTDRRDFFDLAIGNVPFGQYQVDDPAYNKLNFSIHNYFFAKSLDQVRAGGVVAFVTSRYTMDAKDSTVRRYLAQRAELLGAIRLPNDAFKKNAGAEVVSDIIFLQKRDRPLDIAPDWTQTAPNDDGHTVNRYFLEHPEMVLGSSTEISTAHGMDYTVKPIEGADLSDQLHEAVKNIHGEYRETEMPDLGESIDTSIPADPNVKNYSYTVVDGTVYYRENSRMVRPELNQTAEERVKGMVELRECVHRLMNLQMDAATSDAAIRTQQEKLNELYDAFSNQYGLINERANQRAFADDSSYYLLCALEVLDEDGNLERKADMFSKRTIKPHRAVTSVDTASEALAVSISEKAAVDMEYMSQLSGKTQEELAAELQGVIFHLPEPEGMDTPPRYVAADEYLSGNVRQKLREARRAAEHDPAFGPNVEALTAAQPKDLDASEIEVRLGATWIKKEYIQEFMEDTFDTPWYLRRGIQVNYSPFTAEWQITGKSNVSYNDIAAYTTYGTDRANAYKILEDSLNLRDVRIYDTVEDPDGKQRRVLNAKETTLASQKQQAIREAFKDWIWKDPERRQDLVRQYNEEMNSTRPREYDGSHIVFGGINPEITLRDHQKNAIAHVLYGGNTLLAHEVGAGKTFEMAAAAMEAKRLGLCTKSLFAVPNHLTEQWASEFLRLYPNANILVATKKDFEPHNRKKFCSRIATGDYDAIIMGHSQFEKIPISQERQERLLQEQIWEITDGIAEAKADGGEHFTVKQLERTKKSLEQRLSKLQAQERKDDVVTFEQLGVDRLFVDEAHNYKNLFLYTKMRNVAGLSTTEAQKSSDMFAKCRYMDEITGNKGVIFATGTPVSNSMTELYTMQRYLQYDRLKELNMSHFDCWASRFGETVTALELAPEGTGYRARTRFSKFYNLPELMNLFREVADIKTADQLHLPTPEVEYHNVVAKPTEHQREMVKSLSERAAQVHSGSVDPSVDNMLKITSDGRKLGLDQRIINSLMPDEPGTKVNQCVENVLKIWKDGQKEKLTQLVFCDISTPKTAPVNKTEKTLDNPALHAQENSAPEKPFTVYDDIRSKLIDGGVPPEQIAFIHDANTEVKKKDLFAKVRTGQVRVLIGSTSKMGAGMNVQDRLAALHDLDCPWRPGDLAQRKGRIERQGNQNKKVHVFRYVTEGTFDAYLWQTVENKQKFISQIMSSKSPVRSCEDVDETALSFAEIKALCAGDPRIKERMDLDVEVARLKLMKADHQSKQYRLEDQLLKTFPEQIEQNKGYIKALNQDMKTLEENPHPADGFAGMEVRGNYLQDKESAGAALLDACKEVKNQDPVEVGKYRGFRMFLYFEPFHQEYILQLKGQMTHRVTLGSDPRGNLIRMDNSLAAMPDRQKAVQARLDDLYQQQNAAKAEAGKPFAYEEEMRVKTDRLIELDGLLNMDSKEQEKDDIEKDSRPSVLDKLKAQPVHTNTDKTCRKEMEER